MPKLIEHVGFCLVCGNSIHSDDDFESSENGSCHSECLEDSSGQENTVELF